MRKLLFVLMAVVGATAAFAGIDDGTDPFINAKPAVPVYWVTIDLRPPAFSFNPTFINPEPAAAMVPKDWGLHVIIVDPVGVDGECNSRQIQGCKNTCAANRMLSVGCNVDYEWQADGTCKRIVTCDCANPTSPRIAGSKISTVGFHLGD